VDVSVSARQVELTGALRAAIVEKVGRLDRFLDGMDRAEVHLFEERNPRIADKDVCEVTLDGHGHHVRVKAVASEPLAAVDLAVAKLEHKLHRLKTKLTPPKRRTGRAPAPASASVADDVDGLERRIVKSKRFVIDPMSPDDAVLRMELLGHDFYVFHNVDTGRTGVVYRRRSGDVGLIDEGE
jgi:putative sigma-54 modulation protein